MGLFGGLFRKIEDLVVGREITPDFYEDIEEQLILADMGAQTAMDLVEELESDVRKNRITTGEEALEFLKKKLEDILDSTDHRVKFNEDGLSVMLFIGVNGVGKTTTIGKLAAKYKAEGKKVVIAAADTFRAAAIDQLKVWADRSGVDFIAHGEGSDPGAVVYDGMEAAKARKADILMIDTAGRLQNKNNLMEELKKIYKVIKREDPSQPSEVLIVLDTTTGQNALQQAKDFKETAGATGVVLTKLDGTAKGGVIFAIQKECGLSVKYTGWGEKIEDLKEFDAKDFKDRFFE